jgi:hypothetical protein
MHQEGDGKGGQGDRLRVEPRGRRMGYTTQSETGPIRLFQKQKLENHFVYI